MDSVIESSFVRYAGGFRTDRVNKGVFMIRKILGIALFLCSASLFQTEPAIAAQAAKGCTRATLQAAVDSYIAAQQAGNLSKMSLASNVKYVQNWGEVNKEEGLWNSPLPVAFHRSILDVDACRTFTEVIVTEGNQYVIGTRLTVENGKISEIESMYTTKRDWLFNAENYLKYSLAEDWRILNADERVDRKTLIAAGDAYFDHFSDRSVQVPWGTPCVRLEGGMYTARNIDDPNNNCNLGFPIDMLPMKDRSYVVDVDMGTVNIFTLFGNPPGAPDSHTYRVVNGKIRYIHTLSLTVPRVDPWDIMGRQPEQKPKSNPPAKTQ